MGVTSETGIAYGAKNFAEVFLQFKSNLALAIGLSVLLIALQTLIFPFALWLMAPDATIKQLASDYLLISIFGAPAVLGTYVIMGWFIGLHSTRVPLMITLVVGVTNLVFDYFFILVLDWDVKGAAYASVIAQFSGLGLGLVCVGFTLRKLPIHTTQADKIPLGERISHIFKLNRDLFLRTTSLLLVFNYFTAQSGQFGPAILAANALIMELAILISFALDGYAHAAEAMTAESRW